MALNLGGIVSGVGAALKGGLGTANGTANESGKTVTGHESSDKPGTVAGKTTGTLGYGPSTMERIAAGSIPSTSGKVGTIKGGANTTGGAAETTASSSTAAQLLNIAGGGLKAITGMAQPTAGAQGRAEEPGGKTNGATSQRTGATVAQTIGAIGRTAAQAIFGNGSGDAGLDALETVEVTALRTELQGKDISLLKLTRYVDLTERSLNDNHISVLAEWIGMLEATGVAGITLNLRGNRITPRGLAILLAAMQRYPNVVYVVGLGNNPTGDEGAILIADAISRLPIRAVALDSTGMTGVGIQALVTAVASSSDQIISYISMEDNNIQQGDTQTIMLVDTLRDKIVPDGINLWGHLVTH
ncbi:MAG: hypothetical protein LBD43_01100 [Holosporales bacterium]|jgi:hypothetical protein|nr:hypothetical protein [Holosporales bacterium]